MRSSKVIALLLVAVPLLAQGPAGPPSDVTAMIRQFQNATLPWLTVGETVATSLFGILAVIEFGITLGMLALAQADVTIWGATLVRKFLTVGAFYALLLLGPALMQSIVDSYVKFGSMASGVPSITAGDIVADGIDISATMLIAAVGAGVTLSFVSSLLMVLCAFVIGWSFVKLVKGFIMAKIESFITIYAAVIQLGWGASRFTSIYAERYVAAAMATGVKLMVFYFIIGIERALAPAWIATAGNVAISLAGIIPALTLTMSIVLFCSLAEPEKLAANIFSGQPQFTGHDITNTYMPYLNAGIGMTTSTVGLLAGMASGGAMAAPFAATAAAAAGTGARSTAATFATMASAASAGSSRPQSTPPSKQLPPPQPQTKA
jgi:type IV secretion system protein TrbL